MKSLVKRLGGAYKYHAEPGYKYHAEPGYKYHAEPGYKYHAEPGYKYHAEPGKGRIITTLLFSDIFG